MSKRNYALIYQEAIEAIAEIRATQVHSDKLNYSRDLYPFRAIVNACVSETMTTSESLTAISEEIVKHRTYGLILPTHRASAQEIANREKARLADLIQQVVEAETPDDAPIPPITTSESQS